jgi:hypothetical protein
MYPALDTSQSAYFRVNELIVSRSEIDLGGESKQKMSAPLRGRKRDPISSWSVGCGQGIEFFIRRSHRGFKCVTFKLHGANWMWDQNCVHLPPLDVKQSEKKPSEGVIKVSHSALEVTNLLV